MLIEGYARDRTLCKEVRAKYPTTQLFRHCLDPMLVNQVDGCHKHQYTNDNLGLDLFQLRNILFYYQHDVAMEDNTHLCEARLWLIQLNHITCL